MNDANFERNLRELLQPVQPSEGLHERIRQELTVAERRSAAPTSGPLARPSRARTLLHLLRDFGWACAGAAAVLTIISVLPGKSAPTVTLPMPSVVADVSVPATISKAAFEHDGTTKELVSTDNSDQLIETDDGPAREVRYSYVERHAWSNPQTGARVYLEVPREDVYLLPVALE